MFFGCNYQCLQSVEGCKISCLIEISCSVCECRKLWLLKLVDQNVVFEFPVFYRANSNCRELWHSLTMLQAVNHISDDLVPLVVPDKAGAARAVCVIFTSSKEDKNLFLVRISAYLDNSSTKKCRFHTELACRWILSSNQKRKNSVDFEKLLIYYHLHKSQSYRTIAWTVGWRITNLHNYMAR